MFITAKTKKVLSIITLVVILLLILLSPIAFYILFTQKTNPINVAALSTIVLLLGLTLILLILIRSSNSLTINVQNKTIKYFISMLILLVFLSLFISSYELYGLWMTIFKFLPPACTIGLVFILALMLIFFIKDIGYTIFFAVPILTYPFAYLKFKCKLFRLRSNFKWVCNW